MLNLRIARRFIKSKKAQSVAIIIGFGIGIATNIFIGNLITAIEQDLIERTINSQEHIIIEGTDLEYIENIKSILPILEETSQIRLYCKILDGRAFIRNIHEDSPDDIIVRGMANLVDGSNIFNVANEKFEGSFPQEANEVLIGVSMAENLGLTIGDHLNLSISPSIPFGRILYITGIFDIGQGMPNETWVIGHIVMAGMVLFAIDKVSSIAIQLHDHMDASDVTEILRKKLINQNVTVTSWMEKNNSLLNTLTAQSISTKLVQFFILLSVSIAIGAMLSITVVNKKSQIGVLKALGLTDQDSNRIFLLQGGILASFGAIFGVILGLIFISIFNYVGNADIVTITIQPIFTAFSVLIAVLVGLLASYLPAKTSEKIEIVDIIRRS